VILLYLFRVNRVEGICNSQQGGEQTKGHSLFGCNRKLYARMRDTSLFSHLPFTGTVFCFWLSDLSAYQKAIFSSLGPNGSSIFPMLFDSPPLFSCFGSQRVAATTFNLLCLCLVLLLVRFIMLYIPTSYVSFAI